MLQGVMLDMVTDVMLDVDKQVDPKAFMQLGTALKNMAAAQKLDVERTQKIKEQAAQEAVGRVEEQGKKLGLTKATIDRINHAVLGIEH